MILVVLFQQGLIVSSAHKKLLSQLTSTFIPSSTSLVHHQGNSNNNGSSSSNSFSWRRKQGGVISSTPYHVLCSSSSPISSSSQNTSPSPWSPGKWKLTLDFGIDEQAKPDSSSSSLEQNSENTMQLHKLLGEHWGAEGGRLVLPFEVVISSDTESTSDKNERANPSVEMTWLGGKPTGSLQCIPNEDINSDEGSDDDQIYHATYINNKGQQRVQISSGLWRNEPPTPILPSYTKILSGQASSLRMYLKLLNSIDATQYPSQRIHYSYCNRIPFVLHNMHRGYKHCCLINMLKSNLNKCWKSS